MKEIEENMFEGNESVEEDEQKGKEMLEHFADVLLPTDQPGYCFTIPTLSGSVAKVVIPQDVTEKDLDFITLYIQNMLPTFISNLKEELEK